MSAANLKHSQLIFSINPSTELEQEINVNSEAVVIKPSNEDKISLEDIIKHQDVKNLASKFLAPEHKKLIEIHFQDLSTTLQHQQEILSKAVEGLRNVINIAREIKIEGSYPSDLKAQELECDSLAQKIEGLTPQVTQTAMETQHSLEKFLDTTFEEYKVAYVLGNEVFFSPNLAEAMVKLLESDHFSVGEAQDIYCVFRKCGDLIDLMKTEGVVPDLSKFYDALHQQKEILFPPKEPTPPVVVAEEPAPLPVPITKVEEFGDKSKPYDMIVFINEDTVSEYQGLCALAQNNPNKRYKFIGDGKLTLRTCDFKLEVKDLQSITSETQIIFTSHGSPTKLGSVDCEFLLEEDDGIVKFTSSKSFLSLVLEPLADAQKQGIITLERGVSLHLSACYVGNIASNLDTLEYLQSIQNILPLSTIFCHGGNQSSWSSRAINTDRKINNHDYNGGISARLSLIKDLFIREGTGDYAIIQLSQPNTSTPPLVHKCVMPAEISLNFISDEWQKYIETIQSFFSQLSINLTTQDFLLHPDQVPELDTQIQDLIRYTVTSDTTQLKPLLLKLKKFQESGIKCSFDPLNHLLEYDIHWSLDTLSTCEEFFGQDRVISKMKPLNARELFDIALGIVLTPINRDISPTDYLPHSVAKEKFDAILTKYKHNKISYKDVMNENFAASKFFILLSPVLKDTIISPPSAYEFIEFLTWIRDNTNSWLIVQEHYPQLSYEEIVQYTDKSVDIMTRYKLFIKAHNTMVTVGDLELMQARFNGHSEKLKEFFADIDISFTIQDLLKCQSPYPSYKYYQFYEVIKDFIIPETIPPEVVAASVNELKDHYEQRNKLCAWIYALGRFSKSTLQNIEEILVAVNFQNWSEWVKTEVLEAFSATVENTQDVELLQKLLEQNPSREIYNKIVHEAITTLEPHQLSLILPTLAPQISLSQCLYHASDITDLDELEQKVNIILDYMLQASNLNYQIFNYFKWSVDKFQILAEALQEHGYATLEVSSTMELFDILQTSPLHGSISPTEAIQYLKHYGISLTCNAQALYHYFTSIKAEDHSYTQCIAQLANLGIKLEEPSPDDFIAWDLQHMFDMHL